MGVWSDHFGEGRQISDKRQTKQITDSRGERQLFVSQTEINSWKGTMLRSDPLVLKDYNMK